MPNYLILLTSRYPLVPIIICLFAPTLVVLGPGGLALDIATRARPWRIFVSLVSITRLPDELPGFFGFANSNSDVSPSSVSNL